VESLFLDSFGRPDPSQDPPCERTPETTVVQALHLMNSPGVYNKVTHAEGRAAALAASDREPRAIVEELYLMVYSRFPTDDERQVCERLFAVPSGTTATDGGGADLAQTRRQATEDLLWALINTPEFVFKD
jgi:hypothetical protein